MNGRGVDLQHADLPDQVKQSAGQLIGEIWSLARTAADESVAALRESATAERDGVLAEKARLENKITQVAAQLENGRNQLASAEATIGEQREELCAAAATQQELALRLNEARADIEKLRDQINSMLSARVAEIEKLTNRVLQAEQRYSDLTKRTLVDLDRARTGASKLQKQIDAERRTSASRIEEIQSEVQEAQFKLARQGQELGTYMSKAELLIEERDRAASHAMETMHQCGQLENQLAAERARVAELRGQLERLASKLEPHGRKPRSTPEAPRRRRSTGSKLDK